MKTLLTLVLALIVLATLSTSCQSKSHIESNRRQDLKVDYYLTGQLVDNNEFITIDVYKGSGANRVTLREGNSPSYVTIDGDTVFNAIKGDTVWVHVTPTNRYALFNANSNVSKEFVNDLHVGHLLKRAIIK